MAVNGMSTELTLKKIGNLLAKLAEQSEDVYWLSSPDFKSIVYISPAYEKIWQRPRESLYTNPEEWISFLFPEDVANYHPIHAMATRIANDGADARYNESYRIVRPNGEIRWILDHGFPIFNDEGDCCGVTGVAVDITTQKEVEEMLRKSKEAAEAASASKTEFIRNMSHDLRTPLSGIIGMADIISKKTDMEMTQEGARDIHQAGLSLLSLLNEIIETAQLEFGSLPHKECCFSLKKTLDSLVTIFKPAIKHKGLTLETHYDDSIPEILLGEELLLHRIILNLLGNAIKFTDHGSITVSTLILNKTTADITLQITVKDTGIGIPAQKHDVIFDKFTRLTPSYANNYKGSGLGLFAVKQLTEKLGGTIKVDSASGKGSEFICTVSFKIPTLAQIKTTQEQPSTQEATPLFQIKTTQESRAKVTPSSTVKIGSVLLIEDTLLAQKIAKDLLEKAGYSVETAETASNAIEKSMIERFDFIYIDIGLPDGNGIDVAKTIRQNPHNPNAHTFLAALTAHADREIANACTEAGIQSVLDKPLDIEKISDTQINIKKYAEKSDHGAPIIDIAFMVDLLGGNTERAKEMLYEFIAELPEFKKHISAAFNEKNDEQLKYHVHKLHGNVCYTGALQLKEVARAFDKQLSDKTGNYDAVYQSLMQKIDAVLTEYHAMNAKI